MQEIRSSNSPVVAGICDPNKSRARHHHSLKLGSKLKYLNYCYVFISVLLKPIRNRFDAPAFEKSETKINS